MHDSCFKTKLQCWSSSSLFQWLRAKFGIFVCFVHWVTEHISARWMWEVEFFRRDSWQGCDPCAGNIRAAAAAVRRRERVGAKWHFLSGTVVLFILPYVTDEQNRPWRPPSVQLIHSSLCLTLFGPLFPSHYLSHHDQLVLLFGVIFGISSNTRTSFCPCWKGRVYSCLIITASDRTAVWSLHFSLFLWICSKPVSCRHRQHFKAS